MNKINKDGVLAGFLMWFLILGALPFNQAVQAQTPGTGAQLQNVALGKSATQSSNYAAAVASRAVDGNTDGNYHNNSVAATNLDNQPWLQIDLGAVYDISEIKIYNRTDCCQERLDNFRVVYSDAEIISNGNTAKQTPVKPYAGTAPLRASTENPRILRQNAQNVRYIRIYLTGRNILQLAEVQVIGVPSDATQLQNVALGKSATQSSNYAAALASRAVDGNTDGNYQNNSVAATNLDNQPWLQIDLGAVYDISEIKIHNRTDCCQERLDNFRVVYSDAEIISNGNTAKQTPVKPYAGTAPLRASTENPRILRQNAQNVRYIRIYLTGRNILQLAEVQVIGVPSDASAATTTSKPPANTSSGGGVIMAGPVYITSGNCPAGQSWGQLTKVGDNGCLPKVEFHSQEGLSLGDAQSIAVKNGWVMATAEEINNAWVQLQLDRFAYGMLNDGSFAVPVQRDRPPTFKRGSNIGVTGGNQGFFYVKKEAVARTQTAPAPKPASQSNSLIVSRPGDITSYPDGGVIPDSVLKNPQFSHLRFNFLCDSDPGNPMLDGWRNADRPLLLEAATQLLGKEQSRVTSSSLSTLETQLRNDPVRRWQFAPFMLREMWNALVATRPTPAQAQFRKKFEKWAACDETKNAKMTLALWNNHIGKSNDISGNYYFGSVPKYTPNNLGVLIDTKRNGSIEGFLPLDNPLYIGQQGSEAMALLYKPMALHLVPEVDDAQGLRPIGYEMARTALAVGMTTGGVGMIAAAVGPVFLGSVVSAKSHLASGAQILAKDSSTAVAKATSREVAKETGTKLLSHMFGIEKPLGAKVSQATVTKSTQAGEKVLSKVMPQIGTKVGSAIAIVGVVATMGEILGRVVADRLKTDQFDAAINKSANSVKDFNVTTYLGGRPDEFKRSSVFTQLVKMTIADPADLGRLSLDLPEIK